MLFLVWPGHMPLVAKVLVGVIGYAICFSIYVTYCLRQCHIYAHEKKRLRSIHTQLYLLLQLEKGGFSIAATKRKLSSSLIIGPGSGYNLVSINSLLTFFQ
jgi:hypothetical protein